SARGSRGCMEARRGKRGPVSAVHRFALHRARDDTGGGGVPRTATRRKPPRGREILAWFPAMAGSGGPATTERAERAAANARNAAVRAGAPAHTHHTCHHPARPGDPVTAEGQVQG